MAQDFKSWLEELKSRCDIITIMSKYCNLVLKGRSYWTCCPFHMEKTPSMCIYENEQTYHCYGCKEHGDVIKFVQKIESCDFMQAVELLAKTVGMEVPNFSTTDSTGIEKRKHDKDIVLNILNDAKNHYIQNLYLSSAKPAQEYIKKRLLTKKELDDFAIGYSLDYNEMPNYLKNKGYSYEHIEMAGLVEKNNSNHYYDVYAQRLIFPLFNVYNECIGFSARILTNDKTKAKYKNTKQTLVFDKSNTIFGLNLVRALKAKQAVDRVIIVEGQMDVIAMHKAGFKNTVACLGTAFTAKHAKQLKLIASNIVVCLDGDSAGLNAANKIVDVLAKEGFVVRVVKLPNGNDPDEFIKENGISKMQEQIDSAVDYIDFQIDFLAKDINFEKSDEKAKFVRNALKLLEKLGTISEKQIYLKHIKNLSAVPINILQQDLFKQKTTKNSVAKIQNPESFNQEDGTNIAIKFILASMLYKKDYVNYNFNLKKYLKNNTYIKLYDLIIEKYMIDQSFKVSSLYDEFDFDSEPNLVDIINYNFENNGNNKKYYEECLWNIVEKNLKNEQQLLNEQFQKETNVEKRKDILIKVSNITKKLKNKNVEDVD